MTQKEEEVKGKKVAWLLDDFVRIPGTRLRIGLDPLLGLIPGAGDFLSSGAGLAVLAAGARKRIPVGVYARMLGNWALNGMVGAIPGVGDVFSFWFKSNRRNYELMRAVLQEGKEGAVKSSWVPFLFLVLVALAVFTVIGLILWGVGSLLFR